MTRLIDLDAVARPDIEVKLRGETYALPGDVPVPDMLRYIQISEAWDRAAADSDEDRLGQLIEEMYDEIASLFRLRQPDLGDLPISMEQMAELFGQVIGVYQEEEPDPPKPQPSRTRSAKSSPRSASGRKTGRSRS